MTLTIEPLTPRSYDAAAAMIGRLLKEIETKIEQHFFTTTPAELRANLLRLSEAKLYNALLARDGNNGEYVGVLTMYESYALYAGGAFGTIAELYVEPPYREKGIGRALLEAGRAFARTKGWSRLEVTTPPLEAFTRTLEFYENNGFVLSGGRKLKTELF